MRGDEERVKIRGKSFIRTIILILCICEMNGEHQLSRV